MAAQVAKAGDRLTIVACCPRGPVAVLTSRRPHWQCGSCRSTGTDTTTVTLQPGVLLPDSVGASR